MTVWRFGLILSTFLGLISPASAQVLLYAQHLPANTVYMRLVNALPGPASIQTDFAGKVTLGADGPARVSPYFVSTTAGGKTVDLQVDEGGKTVTSTFQPKSGAFITVVLHREGDKIIASIITDKPEYNQLRARLAFYNATRDCPGGVLTQASGPSIFSNIAPDGAAARGINPVAAKVVAGCTAGKTPPLDLGQLDAGGLYTVWMMRPEGNLVAFVARDTIAPPRS